MSERQAWKKTDRELPPEGQVVDTLSDGGVQQPLKRLGQLWFQPDGSMYVYYHVLFWSPLSGAGSP